MDGGGAVDSYGTLARRRAWEAAAERDGRACGRELLLLRASLLLGEILLLRGQVMLSLGIQVVLCRLMVCGDLLAADVLRVRVRHRFGRVLL